MGHILWALDYGRNRVERFSSVRGGEVLLPKEPLRRRRHTVRPIDLCLFFEARRIFRVAALPEKERWERLTEKSNGNDSKFLLISAMCCC